MDDAFRIAKCLGVSIDYLITGKEADAAAKMKEIQTLLQRANQKLAELQKTT
jgi:hypothetical protein